MVLARIDHEEPYWAHQAAHALRAEGVTTANTPTYLNGETVSLHGENHLRSIVDRLESPAQALASFQRLYGDALRPGSAPMSDTEQQTARARTSLYAADTTPDPSNAHVERVPAYAADPGDHETVLNHFLSENHDWEKYRTWDDNTTIANHESLTLRVLFDHNARSRDLKWTIAAYETPVSDRMWHMTVTASTPAPVLNTLLAVLAAGDAWEPAIGSPAIDKTVTEAARPLTDAGWTHTVDGRWLCWQTSRGDVGVQFEAFAAQTPHTHLDTWTLWAGPSINHPTWAIHASAYTPAGLLAHLAEELAHGTGTRRTHPRQAAQYTSQTNTTAPPPAPHQPLPKSRRL
ncbi:MULTISPECIES: DUF317 domain-containing protein [Streptomyces]|uniref:DUF317 domain-containing protein n=1 Tax=Streptomyces TaxID=1883 RepID=UPI0006E176B1|nr:MULTISPECIES: DUF317 domain-containing protein [Streptomyces]MCL6737714.1 DUF317 domain-containing protein [Streptomyces neyagawaensis]MDE1687704.1 DUF317 domain-containing protein [Streptomyces neyagawaensis]MDG5808463.1 DUF317 domain-containing protein [Streptomyces ossamyceticus]